MSASGRDGRMGDDTAAVVCACVLLLLLWLLMWSMLTSALRSAPAGATVEIAKGAPVKESELPRLCTPAVAWLRRESPRAKLGDGAGKPSCVYAAAVGRSGGVPMDDAAAAAVVTSTCVVVLVAAVDTDGRYGPRRGFMSDDRRSTASPVNALHCSDFTSAGCCCCCCSGARSAMAEYDQRRKHRGRLDVSVCFRSSSSI
jgi:hypothetical protein